jgi:hypothetical protein
MQDYQPIELATVCNVGVEFIGPHAQPPLGVQTFHGLPFVIGQAASEPGRCFLGFGDGTGAHSPVSVPIKAQARHLIFAHTLLESKISEGETIGRVVAHYTFHFAHGDPVRVPIRERFEISIVPPPYGGAPFRALPDRKEWLLARDEGEWGDAGRRQAEAFRGAARAYYLWTWQNPHPQQPLEHVVIEPGDRKFLIAAITIGRLDEWPFYRTGKQAVKIVLPQAEDAERPFKLAVDADRGVATYPYPLPQ